MPEAIMALTVLSIGILLTITPVLRGLDNLGDARLNQVASNYAQSKVEEIRSLSYADVGFPSSNPSGVLSQTESVTLQGVQFDVSTEVEYVGSVSNLNVVAGGGDGVPGAYNTGVDYKRVTVRITDQTGDMTPIIFNTIVAPPNLGAHEGLSNVIVTLGRFEPVGSTTNEIAYPYPLTCLTMAGSLTQIFSASTSQIQTYAAIDPNAVDVADPDYYYLVGLGTTCGEEDLVTGWRVMPTSASATQVHVAPTATADVTVELYRPATLEVTVTDEFAAVIASGIEITLTLDNGSTAQSYSSNDSVYNPATGVFTIEEFDGNPLVPGYYDVAADAPAYLKAEQIAVETPSGYPSTLVEALTLQLVGGSGTTTTTTGGTTTTTGGSTTTTGGSTTTTGGSTTTTAPTTTTTTAPTTTTTTLPPGTTITFPAGAGVLAADWATYNGYIMYSQQVVHDRWTNSATDPYWNNSDNFIAVFYSGGWFYDYNGGFAAFTPRSSDILVASIDASADTRVMLNGTNSVVSGIQSGYDTGDLGITPNQYNGSYNYGEWGVTGSTFTAWGSTGGGMTIVTWTVDVEDWLGWDINGATVTFDGGSLTGPQSAVTDADGDVSIDLIDGDTLNLTVTSPYGHETYSTSVFISGNGALNVQLDRPSGFGGIRFLSGNSVAIDHVGFGPWGTSSIDLDVVLLNSAGQATVVTSPGWWTTAGFCANGDVNYLKNRYIADQYEVDYVDIAAQYNWSNPC